MKAKIINGQAPGGIRKKLAEIIPLSTPLVVQIFPIYGCNFKCNYCIFSIDSSRRGMISDQNCLDLNLFKKSVDDMRFFPEKIKVLRFVGIGEPLLHKKIVDMISYAEKAQVADTIELVTNGSLLTTEIADRLIAANLTRLVVSLQGTSSKQYLKTSSAKIDFDQFTAYLSYFYKNKKNTHVYFKIIDSALEGAEDQERYYKIFGDICDSIAIEHAVPIHHGVEYQNIFKDKMKNTTQFGLPLAEVKVCPQPFFTMQINPDGKVVPCYSFEYPLIIGNCRTQSVVDIWKGQVLKAFQRQMLINEKNRLSFPVCKDCEIIKYRFFPEDDLGSDIELVKKHFIR